jgi:WD40 repeat protein
MATRMLAAAVVLCAGLGAAQAQDLPELFTQLGHSGTITSVAFSHDGALLASGAQDKTIVLWDVEGRRELRTLTGHADKVTSVAFSPAVDVLASGSEDGTVKLWDTTNGKELPGPVAQRSPVRAVAYAPYGHWLAASFDNGMVMLWDTANIAVSRSLDGQCGAIKALAFSRDRHTLAAGCDNGRVKLWDVTASDSAPSVLDGHSGAILSVAFADNGFTLVFGSANGTIGEWENVSNPDDLRTIDAYTAKVNAVAISPGDGQMLASGAESDVAYLWRNDDPNSVRLCADNNPLSSVANGLNSVAFSPDGKMLAGASDEDNTIRLWNTSDLIGSKCVGPMASLGGNLPKLLSVAMSPDGGTLATVDIEEKVKLWDVPTGQVTRTLDTDSSANAAGNDVPRPNVNGVAFSTKGRWLASGGRGDCSDAHSGASRGYTLNLWDLAAGGRLRIFCLGRPVYAVAFSPDEHTLAAASGDGMVHLWDVTDANRSELPPLKAKSGAVHSIAFKPDGRLLAAGYADGTVKIWDLVKTGGEPPSYKGHDGLVWSLAWSRDGTMLVSGGWDREVKLWDMVHFCAPQELGRHETRVSSVAFSPNSSVVASGGEDAIVSLWHITSTLQQCPQERITAEQRTLRGHVSLISGVAFSDDSRTLASASFDGSTRLWDVASGREKVSLDAFNDGSFVAITPEGYYDASAATAEDNINVRVGNRVFPISTYRDDFYKPDLVRRSIAGTSLGGLGLGDIRKVDPKPPYIGLVDPPAVVDDATLTVTLRLREAGGGIGDVLLFVNGTAVPAVAPPSADSAAAATGTITRSYQVQLADGPNTVRAEVFDTAHAHRNMSRIAKITANLPPQPSGTLHAVVVGIQEFTNPANNLKFSVSDAELFAATLTKYSAPLFADASDIRLLSTQAQTTRKAVRTALQDLQKIKAGPNDVFVFYAATHGVITNQGKYFLITSDVDSAATMEKQALGADELAKLLADIPIPNKLVVLDTCRAGAAGDQIQRAVLDKGVSVASSANKLARDIGVTVLAAATSDQDALEEYEDNHGLFTVVVTDGLKGDAYPTDKKTITSDGLASYVKEKVPPLAKNLYHHEQYPAGDSNGLQFAIAKVGDAVAAPGHQSPAKSR